jgi:hypothetical protein
VEILIVRRRFGKARVIVGDERRKEGVAVRRQKIRDRLSRLASTLEGPLIRRKHAPSYIAAAGATKDQLEEIVADE